MKAIAWGRLEGRNIKLIDHTSQNIDRRAHRNSSDGSLALAPTTAVTIEGRFNGL